MNSLATLFNRAKHELACPRCSNRGGIMTQLGIDECPDCHGEGRNKSTIELLGALVEIEENRR